MTWAVPKYYYFSGFARFAAKLSFWYIIGHAKPGKACQRSGICGCLAPWKLKYILVSRLGQVALKQLTVTS